MSAFPNNTRYMPVANIGEFSNGPPPLPPPPPQAQFMYFNAGPGYEAGKNVSYQNLMARQPSPMLQQQETPPINNNMHPQQQQQQQQEHYAVQHHFQQSTHPSSYNMPYPNPPHQSMPHNIVPHMQNVQEGTPPPPYTPSVSHQNSWIPSEPLRSQMNSVMSPTGQRYSSMHVLSMANSLPSFNPGLNANSEQNDMMPPKIINHYGSVDIQNENFATPADVRHLQQSPQRGMQMSQSQSFAQTSHRSSVQMSQSYHQIPSTSITTKGMSNGPVSFSNSLQNQNHGLTNSNMQQSSFLENLGSCRVPNGHNTSSVQSHTQTKYDRHSQPVASKSSGPSSVNSMNRSQVSSTNKFTGDSAGSHKSAKSSSSTPQRSVSNSLSRSKPGDIPIMDMSQIFRTNFVNRPEEIRNAPVTERLLAAPVAISNHENANRPSIHHFENVPGVPRVDKVGTQKAMENTAGAATKNRPDNINTGQIISQRRPTSDMSLQGRGRGTNMIGQSQSSRGQVMSRGNAVRGMSRGAVRDRGRGRVMRGATRVANNEPRMMTPMEQTLFSPAQWHRPTYQSDIEAMRANANTDQDSSNRAIHVSRPSQMSNQSEAQRVEMPPNSSQQGYTLSAQFIPVTHQRSSTDPLNRPISTNNMLSVKSSHSPKTIADPINNNNSGTNERDIRRGVSKVKDNELKIQRESMVVNDLASLLTDACRKEGKPNSQTNQKRPLLSKPTESAAHATRISSYFSHPQNISSTFTSTTSTGSPTSVTFSSKAIEKDMVVQRNSPLNKRKPASQETQIKTTHPCMQKALLSPSFSLSHPRKPSSLSSHKPNKVIKSEPCSGLSARDRVFSLWKAGQVVGRTPSRGRGKVKGAPPLKTTISTTVSETSESEISKNNTSINNKEQSASSMPKESNDVNVQLPFYALFHGHKIMCMCSKHGNFVLVCQFMQECFPDKGKGRVSNCINRALRIKKKTLEHPSKDKIVVYLKNCGYLHEEPVYTISLDDARRVYHCIYSITNCSSSSCVVKLTHQLVDLDTVVAPSKRTTRSREILRRIKKEITSKEDGSNGNSSKTLNSEQSVLNTVNCSERTDESDEMAIRSGREINSEDNSDDLIIVEGPEDPFFLRADKNQSNVGGVCNTIIGRVRSYHHKGENYLVVPDLCEILGYNEFMSGVEKDDVDLYSCCNDILSFLNGLQCGFVRLKSGQSCLIREKDIGSHSTYDEEVSEGGSIICPLKRVSCKQEVIDEDSGCTSPKQPRLELEMSANISNENSISLTSADNVSNLNQMHSMDNAVNEEVSCPKTKSSDACIDDDINKETSIIEKQVQNYFNSDVPSTVNIPEIANNTPVEIRETAVEDTIIIVCETSSHLLQQSAQGNLESNAQLGEDQPRPKEIICSTQKNTLEKSQSPHSINNVTIFSHEQSPVVDARTTVNYSSDTLIISSGEKENHSKIDNNDRDKQNKVTSCVVLPKNTELQTQSPTEANLSSPAFLNNATGSTDPITNRNIFTVINNPHKLNATTIGAQQSQIPEKANSGSSSKSHVKSLTPRRHSDSTRMGNSEVAQPTIPSNFLCPPVVKKPSEMCPSQILSTRVIDRRHSSSPVMSLEAAVTGTNRTEKEISSSSNTVETVIPNMISNGANPSSSLPVSRRHNEKLDKDVMIIETTVPEKSHQPCSSNSMKADEKALASPLSKQRSSSFDSPSSSTFLRAAASPSFETKVKNVASKVSYCADDLELVSSCSAVDPCPDVFKTKQSLLNEMVLLRYKNKTLQDMVKHLRRELLNSKEKNEKSGKMIKYYEKVLQEITATFKDGESEEADSKKELETLSNQQMPQPQISGNPSSPICIDD